MLILASMVCVIPCIAFASPSSLEEQRELLEDICDVRTRFDQEVVALRDPTSDTHRRLNQLLERWQRRFSDSKVFNCEPGGYCFSLCPAIVHPGRFGFPPVTAADRAHCAPALPPNDPCATFKKKACDDRSYLCTDATILSDHARCHSQDDLLAVLARGTCSSYTTTWQGEAMPAKPYVSTAGDPNWCKLFADPPPECGGAPEMKPAPETPETFCAKMSKTVEQENACLRVCRNPRLLADGLDGGLSAVFPQFDSKGVDSLIPGAIIARARAGFTQSADQ